MKRYVKPILIALAVILVLIQFIRPAKNQSNEQSAHLYTQYTVPDSVQAILKVACDDCHSNYTVYPWYAEVQPVTWWLNNHIVEGKRHLNFSTFTTRPLALQNHKLEEIIEMVGEEKMPLSSYTWIHRDAMLSAEQRKMLVGWAQSTMNELAAKYPPDSLVMKRR